MGVSLECVTADFSQFFSQTAKFGFWVAGWGLVINVKFFRDFFQIP